jgi:peroxiredoxin/mono/diheme cytochrome c family protein
MRIFWMAGLMALTPLTLSADESSLATTAVDPVATDQAEGIPLGKKIDNFTLRDFRGKPFQLSDLDDSQVIVVTFMGVDCPLVRLYGPRLEAMSNEYSPQDVRFIGINSNTQDPPTRIAAFANKYGVKFPILKDPGSSVADQFGALRTPEVFILDRDRVVRYWGRVDDQFGFTSGVGYSRQQAERHDVKEAIDELLAGKAVSVPVTKAPGCHIGRVAKVAPHGDVTYANQISRLFNAKCVECHRDGQIGPFPMTTYEEVLGWGEMIREVVDDGRMPPWHANPAHGTFKNDCRLTDDEKNLVARWVENGQPEGDVTELPAPPVFHAGWGIPEPDQVFYMNDDGFEVPAEGVVEYQHYVVETNYTEDKWVTAAEARPGNFAVVHHIIVFVIPPNARGKQMELQGALLGYAPGTQPTQLRDGYAIKIPKGSRLVFQLHYTPVGTVEKDRSAIGFKFMDPADVTHEVRGGVCGTTKFTIPAGADNHKIVTTEKLKRDTALLSMLPHMHLRGKAFTYEAKYPDGTSEILLDVPEYDFNWQLWYEVAEPKLLPKGTELVCTAYYDNSESNVYNPDASIDVGFGDQTWEEMMFGWYAYAVPKKPATTTQAK